MYRVQVCGISMSGLSVVPLPPCGVPLLPGGGPLPCTWYQCVGFERSLELEPERKTTAWGWVWAWETTRVPRDPLSGRTPGCPPPVRAGPAGTRLRTASVFCCVWSAQSAAQRHTRVHVRLTMLGVDKSRPSDSLELQVIRYKSTHTVADTHGTSEWGTRDAGAKKKISPIRLLIDWVLLMLNSSICTMLAHPFEWYAASLRVQRFSISQSSVHWSSMPALVAKGVTCMGALVGRCG